MRIFALLLLVLSMTNCSVINVAVNRPCCCPTKSPSKPHPTTSKHSWETFDGTRFAYVEALPKAGTKPKGVVILVTGWDGTMSDYQYLTDSLAAHGYAVYGSEMRNQSGDPKWWRRGCANSWHDWIHDLQCFTDFVRKAQPQTPIYYHGHSLGCLVTIQTVAEASPKNRPNGIILQSPAIAMMPESHFAGLDCALTLVSWIRPPHLLFMDLMKMELTGDKQWDCDWMRSKDRVHAGYTIRFVNEVSKMGVEARKSSHSIPVPVLALEGCKDKIAGTLKPEGALDEYISNELSGKPIVRRHFEEGRHLLVAGCVPEKSGVVKEHAVRDIIHWLANVTP